MLFFFPFWSPHSFQCLYVFTHNQPCNCSILSLYFWTQFLSGYIIPDGHSHKASTLLLSEFPASENTVTELSLTRTLLKIATLKMFSVHNVALLFYCSNQISKHDTILIGSVLYNKIYSLQESVTFVPHITSWLVSKLVVMIQNHLVCVKTQINGKHRETFPL